MKKTLLCIVVFFLIYCTVNFAQAATYYIDSNRGNDQNDGLSPQTAWKTVDRVNRISAQPGDRFLFARGGLWRQPILPHSGVDGNPVYYGAYGKGPLPLFYGSVKADQSGDWEEFRPGIWVTKKLVPKIGKKFNETVRNKVAFQGDGRWDRHQENGAKSVCQATQNGFKIECLSPGKSSNHIQIWGPTIMSDIPASGIQIVYRARCSKPWSMPQITIQNSSSPWSVRFSAKGSVPLTESWKEYRVFLARWAKGTPLPRGEVLRYHLSLGTMPADSILQFEILDVHEATLDMSKYLKCDVGNIIFDHGQYQKLHRCGIKKWSLDDCRKPGDYWFDAGERRVYLRFDTNPGHEFKSLELALNQHIVNQSNCHDIVYENLALAYGAAHGFGGGNTRRIVIRKCDIYYIGGGHQHTRPDGVPVRFGNGIEFWGNCDNNLVEECRLWEIYDAALTNQGRNDTETNLVYRKNVIWNSEYSFEYWNAKKTDHVLFEDNICLNAGSGWAHDQRPDPNGAHLMFYRNKAETTGFVIRNNVFSESTEVCVRMDSDWRSGLTLEGNKYYQSEKPLVRWLGKTYYGKDELKRMSDELGMEKTGTTLKKPWKLAN